MNRQIRRRLELTKRAGRVPPVSAPSVPEARPGAAGVVDAPEAHREPEAAPEAVETLAGRFTPAELAALVEATIVRREAMRREAVPLPSVATPGSWRAKSTRRRQNAKERRGRALAPRVERYTDSLFDLFSDYLGCRGRDL